MRLFRRRPDSPLQSVILPLNDPRLAEHARQLADFADTHHGKGHELRNVRTRQKGQTIVCRCGLPTPGKTHESPLLALMEDEAIDDDGER